ncbi:MAG: hypothetical protein ACI4R8_03780 [Candidatus Caccovivens sp.]
MQKVLFNCVFFVLVVAVFSSIFPYPIFSNHTNISAKEATEINNYHEIEIQSETDSSIKILSLTWEDILHILPQTFEIVDLESEEILQATTLGGRNHADIKLNQSIYKPSWERHPVLVKLTESAYLPASLSAYPHGYDSHFCLHFIGSKTHGTQKVDSTHQNCIKKAQKLGQEYINKQ